MRSFVSAHIHTYMYYPYYTKVASILFSIIPISPERSSSNMANTRRAGTQGPAESKTSIMSSEQGPLSLAPRPVLRWTTNDADGKEDQAR